MQTTHRAHDNFALNFAIEQANALGLPLQVYHGLRHDYPWSSDRFHTWILESVADLYADFEAKGINYAFWLDRSEGEYTQWPAGMRGLARKVETPVIAVESATVVPMAYHQKEQSTARGIRTVLMEALPHYLWPVGNPELKIRRTIELGFEPTLVGRGGAAAPPPLAAGIAELVAGCDVDHSVPPSTTFRGGTCAGRARLAEFLRTGIGNCTEDRNDPNQPDAVTGCLHGCTSATSRFTRCCWRCGRRGRRSSTPSISMRR
jgi:hypothetical protein